jgi:hypothetical protein
MEVLFKVHSAVEDDVTMPMTLNGSTVDAKVPGLVVELVSDDGSMCHTHRFVPGDMAAAKALFEVGAKITLTFSAA